MDERIRESARRGADPLKQAILLRRAGRVRESLDLMEQVWDGGAAPQAAELILEAILAQPEDERLQHAGRLDRLAHRGLVSAGTLLHGLFPAVGAIVGRSPAMQSLRAFTFDVAQGDRPVVLWGESGVGHELAARTVHALSGRSEFHEGYGPRRHSLFAREISELPAEGGTLYVSYAADDQGWEEFVLETCERRNLRLVVGAVVSGAPPRLLKDHGAKTHYIPPLRERFEDLPELVRELLGRAGATGAVEKLRAQDVKRLEWHDWPGNVRELANHVSRAVMECSTDDDVSEQLFQSLFGLPGEVAERRA